MINRRTILTVAAAAIMAFALPVLAAAQGTYDPYGRPDYRRDRDYGRDRGYGRYDRQTVRNSIHRLKDLSGRFRSDVDRALDRSRVDGTRREDQINNIAADFQRAAGDLKSSFNDGRDLNRSRDEAQRVFNLASRIEHVLNRSRIYDNRVASDWAQIRQELNIISDAYGNRGGYYGRDDDWRRDRDDDYRRDRNRNDGWWRRLPFPQ
jgi:hypothetical protein